jgi:hypothetical protein
MMQYSTRRCCHRHKLLTVATFTTLLVAHFSLWREHGLFELPEAGVNSTGYNEGVSNRIQQDRHQGRENSSLPNDWNFRALDEHLDEKYLYFPTIQERIRLYAGDWYTPPESDSEAYKFKMFHSNATKALEIYLPERINPQASLGPTILQLHSNGIPVDSIFFANKGDLQSCAVNNSHGVQVYCVDVCQDLLPVYSEALYQSQSDIEVPLLLQFGDSDSSIDQPSQLVLPHFRKFRKARIYVNHANHGRDLYTDVTTDESAQTRHKEPIIWNLNVDRHFGNLPLVDQFDVPWSHKLNQSIFWGAPTGTSSLDSLHNYTVSDRDQCRAVLRCRLVYDSAHSSRIRARLVRTRGRFMDVIDGISIVGGRISVKEQLRYKGIIVLEGNDVASSLKWALYSRSVVLMPPPTFTSYAMEELLVPWVHYIPLARDLSDVEEKAQWMLDHPRAAQRISLQGRLWIYQLWTSTSARDENLQIQRELVRRYQAHWVAVKG